MKQVIRHLVVCGVLGVLAGLPQAGASTPTNAPYKYGFEADAPGTFVPAGPWGTNGEGSISVVSSAALAAAGSTNFVVATNYGLTLDISAAANCTTGYVRFYTQPTFYDDNNGASLPASTSWVSAAFYFTTSGVPKAYTWNGTTNVWTNFNKIATPVPSNAWLQIMVSLRYAHSNYDIWMSTDNAPMSLWATNVTMPSGATNMLNRMMVQNSFRLDEVALLLPPRLAIVSPYGYATAVPSGTNSYEYNATVTASISGSVLTQFSCVGWTLMGNANDSGLTNGTTISLTLNLTNDATLTWQWYSNSTVLVLNASSLTSLWAVLAGDYEPGERTLAGRQGRDLASGFLEGERIRIFYTNGWNQYVRAANGTWQPSGLPSPLSPDLISLGGGMGMVAMRSNLTDRSFGYNYGSGGVSLHTNLVGITIQGGWNFLAWPYKKAGPTNYWGFGQAHLGDRLFFLDGTSGRVYWDGTKWMKDSLPLNKTLVEGQVFWFRNSGAPIQWQPVNPP